MDHRQIRLEIVEQPKQRGMRFRYECEGRSAGSIPGENTTSDKKTWPSCQILNYPGMAIMRVSLVSKDDPPRPHPHSLVGRDCNNGVCQITIDPGNQMQGVFPNLGIQCVRRKEVSSAVQERLRIGVNPFGTPMDGDERSTVDVDLNIVRLCFEAFLPDQHGNYTQKLTPVVSNPIYDKKATSSSVLKICRVDKTYGSALGNDEIFLLCDKVQKEDIEVVFSHKGWEKLGNFSSPDVHRQVAIVFKTPPYHDENIQESVEVEFRLRRPSDKETSKPVVFTYLPVQHDAPTKFTFPSSLTRGFGQSDPRRKAIRNFIERRNENATKTQERMSLQRPIRGRFPGLTPTSRRVKSSINDNLFIPMQRPENKPNTVLNNQPGSSNMIPFQPNRSLKKEVAFNSWNPTGSQVWGNPNHVPFPSSHSPQPASQVIQNNLDEMFNGQTHLDAISTNLIIPDLEPGLVSTANLDVGAEMDSYTSLSDILKLDSFPSIGPEATSQVLGDPTLGISAAVTAPDMAEIDYLMQQQCSIEKEMPGGGSQRNDGGTLMSITETPSNTPGPNSEYLASPGNASQQTFTNVLSPNQPLSPPMAAYQQHQQISPLQFHVDHARANTFYHHDVTLSPTNATRHQMMSPIGRNVQNQQNLNPFHQQDLHYQMANSNNNNHQPRNIPAVQDGGDEIENFLKNLQR